ncbi:uncharacterized protein LOC133312514 [Gastrolobium bilobum]|uniref:uncharacterized protein LOC133312514 n=1 Tax=Gastrolobium bilobum TaxID=150636 RepID=UPI002AAF2717|nr:uncharacterized protein LOC133312514 [Gastrolobium bilobum]
MAWVRLPEFPMEYVNTTLIKSIGNWLGKFVRIDAATTSLARGRFARMCVELDLTKALQVEYKVEGRLKRVEYEGLHLICYGCGKYGHRLENCPNKICMVTEQENSGLEKDMNSQETNLVDGKDMGEEKSKFGPWMQVLRGRRNRGNQENRVELKQGRGMQPPMKREIPLIV